MEINASIGNPVIRNNADLQELTHRVKEIDPLLDSILIKQTKVVITRMGHRTFPFGANPSIDWIVTKVKYMNDNNL